MIYIDGEKCTGCGACIAVCPAMVIEERDSGAVFVHGDSCISCYHCVAVCPVGAVACDEFPLEEFRKIPKSKAATPAALKNLMLRRRSVREFKDKEVPRDLLEELVTVGSHAPTGRNEQGVNFTVVTNQKLIRKIDTRIFNGFESLAKLADSRIVMDLVKTVAGDDEFRSLKASLGTMERYSRTGGRRELVLRNAPVLIVAHTAPDAATGKDDCVIAMDQMMMVANARGLGATWIGILVGAARLDPWIKRQLKVPLRNSINSAMVLGWPKYSYKRMVPRKIVPVRWIG